MKAPRWDSGLTVLQVRTVKYCHQHDCSPIEAARAGICSVASVRKWGVKKVERWLAAYRDQLPPPPEELAESTRVQLNEMLGASLAVVRNTLITGEGDATAVKTARWIIEGILAEAAPVTTPDRQKGFQNSGGASSELAAAIRLIKG